MKKYKIEYYLNYSYNNAYISYRFESIVESDSFIQSVSSLEEKVTYKYYKPQIAFNLIKATVV